MFNTADFSTNWSGQVLTGGTYTGVGGQWTVPTVVPSINPEYSASWIGVDGTASSTLVQTGTAQQTVNGLTDYFAWVELLPGASEAIPNAPVSPGDSIQAAISETAADVWTIGIEDLSEDWYFSQEFSYVTPGLSVEWIEEAPTVNGGQSTLADFNSLQFSNMGVGGGTAGSQVLTPVYMTNPSDTAVIAYPGPFQPATNSFTEFYGAPTPTVTSVTPNVGSVDGGTTITIEGSNFTPATTVAFGGTNSNSVVVASSSTLVAISPAESPGTVDVVASTAFGASGTSSADHFTFQVTPPLAPTGLQASLGNGQATLSWVSPSSDGGSPITSYTASITDITTSTPTSSVVVSGSPPSTSAAFAGLTPGDTYDFSVAATNALGASPASLPLDKTLPAAYFPVAPARICDTRSAVTSGATDQCTGKTIGTGGTLVVQVTGNGGIPSGATAVVANVTAVNPTAPGYLTAWPEGSARPLASNLNFSAGQVVPNLVTVPLSASGALDLFNATGSVDVIVDVTGYYGPGSGVGFTPLAPARICDTRTGVGVDQCTGKTLGAAANPETLSVQVTGNGGIPAGATAVVANVTVTDPTAPSYLTAWPDGTTRPLASNLNFSAAQTVPNRVVIPLSASGSMDVFNAAGAVDVIIDVTGYYSTASTGYFEALPPARICDTRPTDSSGLTDACTGKTLAPGGTLNVHVANLGGVPANASGVVANVTVTNTTAPSYLTVYPGGTAMPLASDLNWTPGLTVPNLVVAELGATGELGVFNAAGSTDVIVDIAGWFTS